MCLIVFAYRVHPVYKLLVAANRDEFYGRLTAPAHYWEDRPDILAGRDLEKMGTWMGVTTSGRFAALTNYRDPKEETKGKRSRGELVSDALKHKGRVKDYMQSLVGRKELYPGFNLLAGDGTELYYYSNKGQELQKVEPGIYGVSNHLLNTQWPKVQKGKEGMSQIIKSEREDRVEELLNMLQNADQAPDELLPHTGVSLEWERMLSPLFIKSEDYGTRSSTVMLMSDKEIQYVERVFSKKGTSDQQFTVELLS
ncbi:NRDE family protein [Bacillus sp. ISL-40]|uniref:NRDE family protein n=1 Tax=unclassified Bacillus (in: firmicutes) TaxID=185979 RepID=UPI001BECFFEA|nr:MULTISPECIES: NRDE family protein [unclassified Bacillus (in: firmicutes)]MBT2699626.1 NRDE family protein [Bacillus sp. ISL-40]MBT2724178.1 NRDE family protein [Bacillus sp. ISL-46]MBT2741092.1 NRDE family protein [Bacillus sp. ISL-77]